MLDRVGSYVGEEDLKKQLDELSKRGKPYNEMQGDWNEDLSRLGVYVEDAA